MSQTQRRDISLSLSFLIQFTYYPYIISTVTTTTTNNNNVSPVALDYSCNSAASSFFKTSLNRYRGLRRACKKKKWSMYPQSNFKHQHSFLGYRLLKETQESKCLETAARLFGKIQAELERQTQI
jgi:hypothetical protein